MTELSDEGKHPYEARYQEPNENQSDDMNTRDEGGRNRMLIMLRALHLSCIYCLFNVSLCLYSYTQKGFICNKDYYYYNKYINISLAKNMWCTRL